MAHRCNHCQSTCVGYRAREPTPSPDIALLMATNDPPSASQEEEFRRVRIDGVKRLAELETIIGELQQTLEGIMVERDALAWKVEHYRLVLNPVRRLPVDILREIFLFACARTTTQPSHFYLTPPRFLAAVCHSWNHIAVTSPQLWRQPKLSFDYEDPNFRRIVDKASLLLGASISRAGTCPLWLDLHLVYFSYSISTYPFLLAISSRVQRMRIRTSDLPVFGRPEFRRFADGLATLVHVDLCMETNSFTPPTTFSLPHTVQDLVITPYAEFSDPGVDLNWSHLRSLVLRCPGTLARPILRILSRVPRLRSLTFSDDRENTCGPSRDSHEAFDALITIRHLTDMVVESSTPSLCGVLAKISAPSLERLVIRGAAREIFPHVNDMLQRSDYTLQHLTLQSLGDEHDSVDAGDSLIRLCDSLRELSLLGIKAGAQSITRLLSSLESLPRLRVLALDISYVYDFGTTTQITVANGILTFLESRRRPTDAPDSDTGGGSCVDLESFTLHAPPEEVFDFTAVQHQRIKVLRASGLLLYICRYDINDPRLY